MHRYGLCKLLMWGALLLMPAVPLHALTKILIVPTARTMGSRRYVIDLDRKAPLFNGSIPTLTLTPKIGISERAQLEMKIPLKSGSDSSVLLNGKYMFAVADRNRTAVAFGLENLGSGSRAVPYFALSHLFQLVDLTVGIARGEESLATFFTGIDYRPIDSFHILADYNTGRKTFASFGYQYDFSRQWSVKSGLEARHNARTDLLIKVSYSNTY